MGADYTLFQTVDAVRSWKASPLWRNLAQSNMVVSNEGHGQAYLNQVAERLRTSGLYTVTRVVAGESPAAAVPRCCT